MVNRMRSNRSHTANRRSHHALTGARLTVSKEGTVHVRHRALLDGTPYRGRSVMDVTVKRSVKKAEKASKK
jgi:ribosomal protein L32